MKLELAILAGLALVSAQELVPRGSPPRTTTGSTSNLPGAPQPTRTRSRIELMDKADLAADAAEKNAASMRLQYHDTAKSFQHKYSSAHQKYNADKDDPTVRPERLYGDRRKADKLMKEVGKSQKSLANAYAKASKATDEAGRDDRAARNDMKAKATAAQFYATKTTYKTAKDALKAKHLPDIAMRVRERGKPGSSHKATRIEGNAASAAARSKRNEFTMYKATKRYRVLRGSGGRDTDSEVSDTSQE